MSENKFKAAVDSTPGIQYQDIKHLPFYWVATSGIDIRNRNKMAKLSTMNVKLVSSPLTVK